MRGIILTIMRITLLLGLAMMMIAAALNGYVCGRAAEHIVTEEKAAMLQNADCILVLGCSVRADGTPSAMLQDRVETGIRLYKQGVADKILMSGDHGQDDYNEVQVMKDMAVAAGVPAEDVFMDHAGFSTYESVYRAKEIFQADKIVIVTQKYHLYRGIYTAEELGLSAYGVPADSQRYAGQWMRDLREIAARVKDFFAAEMKIEPTYLGEAIPVDGDGNQTNDR